MPSDALPDDPKMLQAMLLAERAQNEWLRQIIKDLQRHQFGRRAETPSEQQMLLGLEDVEQSAASKAAGAEQATPAARQAELRSGEPIAVRCRHICRRLKPPSTSTACRCCQCALHRIGEDKSERLDIVPAQFRVLVTIRPKYACRQCEDGVVQAPARQRG
jgi:hypothetical protein